MTADAGRPPSLGGETVDFLRLLWAVDHALQKASKRMERTIGVTGPQRHVIRIVGRFPGISVGRLATLLDVHPSTVTGLSKRLVRLGLIRRRVDPHDARRLTLGLTPKGRAIEAKTAGTIEAALGTLLATTNSAKVGAAREVLESLREILRRELGKASRP